MLLTTKITAASHSNHALLFVRCMSNTLLIILANSKSEKKYRLYMIKQHEYLVEAMLHFNVQEAASASWTMFLRLYILISIAKFY
jgi:hypothetical protein